MLLLPEFSVLFPGMMGYHLPSPHEGSWVSMVSHYRNDIQQQSLGSATRPPQPPARSLSALLGVSQDGRWEACDDEGFSVLTPQYVLCSSVLCSSVSVHVWDAPYCLHTVW